MTILVKTNGAWADVYALALLTRGKDSGGREPTSDWKKKMIRLEHSPLRALVITASLYIPYFVSVHLTRHKIGIEHFVSSQRGCQDRGELKQGALVYHAFVANGQAILNISRARLCKKAAVETKAAWRDFLDKLQDLEPELVEACLTSCSACRTRCVD